MRRPAALAPLTIAGLLVGSPAHAVTWPVTISITQCITPQPPYYGGVCANGYLEAWPGGVVVGTNGAPWGTWSVAGGRVTLVYEADVDGDGILDAHTVYDGRRIRGTRCARGTWQDWTGDAGSFQVCV